MAKKAAAKKAAKKSGNLKPRGRATPAADKKLRDATPGLQQLAAETAARAAADATAKVITGPNVDLLNGHKVTTRDKVRSTAKGYISLKKDAQGASGAISQMLQKAEERHHLNRKAFMAVMKFHTMSDSQLAIVWDVFLKYADDLGIPERASAQQEMFKNEPKDEEDEEDGQTDLETTSPVDAAAAAVGLAPSRRPSGMRLVSPPTASEDNDAA